MLGIFDISVARLASYGALAAASLWAGWTLNAMVTGEQIANLKTEYATAQARAVEKAHAETIRLQAKADAAAKQHAARAAALAHDAAGVRTALVSLSDAADAALHAAKGSHAACLDRATAFSVVFEQCTGQLESVAGHADALSNDRQALIDAWPVQSKP